jgi:N-acetyl sugar amidotransferase
MKFCKNCVLPNTKPGIIFDSEGVCSACRSVEEKHRIDWEKRSENLHKICDKIRGSNGNGYDCLVPVSGGKDSTYQLYVMKEVYKLKVLAVNVVAHLQTIEGIENLNSAIDNLGIDLIKVNVRPSSHQKIRKTAFFNIGNPNYAEHRVVFSAVARIALFYKTPLVAWGEDIGTEFGGNISESVSSGSAEDLINNDLFRESNFYELIDGIIKPNEIFFYHHPEIEEIKKRNVKSIYLGYFHWWDGYKHKSLSKNFGFRGRDLGPLSGNIINYDNIDEKLCEVHKWIQFLKFGFWRPHDEASYLIWNGYISREEGVKRVNAVQYEFPEEYLKEFLEYHQIKEKDFWLVLEKWRNREIWHKVNDKWILKHELL